MPKIKNVKEIQPKIKEIETLDKDESELEKEVETAESENLIDFMVSEGIVTPVLSADGNAQDVPITREAEQAMDREPEFSQTISYTIRQGTVEDAIRYAPSSRVSETSINPGLRRTNQESDATEREFNNTELAKLRGLKEERRYAEPIDPLPEKPRRRYPWEV